MTIQDYFEALNGQYIEMSGPDAVNQCVDNANFYIKWILRLPMIEWTNAVDFETKSGENYDWIPNTPTNVPLEGDLVVWTGKYGHIGVFMEGDQNRFTSFDENYPTGSPAHAVEHSYSGVKGWLHPKVKLQQGAQILIDQLRAERDTNWNLYQGALQKQIEQEEAIRQKNATIDTLTKENLSLKETITKLTDEKIGLSTSLQEATVSLKDKTVALSVCEGQLANRKDLYKWTWNERFYSLFRR